MCFCHNSDLLLNDEVGPYFYLTWPKLVYPVKVRLLVFQSLHCLNQNELLLSHSRVNQTMVQAIATGGMQDKLYT